MTLRCLFLCTVLLLGSFGGTELLSAQESRDTADTATTAPQGENQAAGEDSETIESAENLIERTLAGDIDTASYFELVAWCRDLGLNDSGTRQALQQRLYAYYRISPPAAEAPEEEGKQRLIEIKSAKETQYFTVEQVDEDYVLLLGDVLVEIREEDATHRIRAHEVLLNETESILSAEGGIEYTLIKGNEEEVFRGERLTFDMDSWEGVFFGGGMEADRVVGGETIRFRFSGESISRLEDNTVIIDRGIITSCDIEGNPHYHIRARKIWVLAPNEWAILHAVLYVGRIPLLYLPFFFHPGDEFFFHPAIGYRNREGNFIQTTTYLIGQKKRSASALSFLAATEESTTQYEVERHGLFLRQIPDKPVRVDENRFLKVMLDLYSRLGGFAGVEGRFPQVNFKGGIGFSRTVYEELYGAATYYTPWIDLNSYHSSWNEAFLFGLSLPFRFGLESSWNLGNGPYRFSGKFEYYSDPYFPGDFYNRAEDTGLTRLVGIEPAEETVTVGEKGSLTWELNGKVDLSDNFDTPLVKNLSFPYITANLLWNSETNTQFVAPDATYNPARKYFYPVSLKLPSVSFQMLGDLLNISLPSSKSSRGATKPSDRGGSTQEIKTPVPADLRSPTVHIEPPQPAPDKAAAPSPLLPSPIRPPEPKKSVPVSLQKTPLQLGLSYQLRPTASVEQSFNSDTWNNPEDVTYDLKYTSLDTRGIFNLNHSLRVLENVLLWSGNFSLSGNYRSRYRQSFPLGTEWTNLVEGDQKNSQFNLKFTEGLDYFPFADDPTFGKTSLSYDIGSTFYRYIQYDALTASGDYSGELFTWDDEWFTLHSAQAALRWRMFDADNSLSFSSQLPPRLGSFTGNLEFTIWLLTTTVNSVFKDVGDDQNNWTDFNDWRFQPLVLRETLRLGDNVNFSEELRFDVNRYADSGLLAKSLTSLKLWNFTGSFTMDYMWPQQFNTGTNSWEPYGDQELLPSYINLSYRQSGKERLYWKNRIRIGTSVATSWSMNIQQFTDNSLDFSLTFDFWLYKFLKLSATTTSSNTQTFKYFRVLEQREPGLVTYVNPIEDLINSFRFFDPQAREDSTFNLRSFKVEAVHYLDDWNLSLSYEGKPYLVVDPGPPVSNEYQWQSSFSIILQWLPIPEIRSNPKREWNDSEDRYESSLRG
ncbi:MAG: hypothetical protein JSV89_03545 [Spirochaetaceae bacterium]|nr:MAG: hypothetical protein JSV89_03545 [Spirochaetaceae bacterium]